MPTIPTRVEAVEARIVAACARAGRARNQVRLIAVSKTRSNAEIAEGFAAGLREFGENRVQEARSKTRTGLPPGAVLHLIGHLQSNKAAEAAELFSVIHTVDSPALLERLEARATGSIEALVQVNLAGEPGKHGALAADLPVLLEAARRLERVRVRGLMCLPPFDPDPERTRSWFTRLRELRDGLGGADRLPQLSMGMSHDFEIAIEEGATLIRVGEGIFGPRQPPRVARGG